MRTSSRTMMALALAFALTLALACQDSDNDGSNMPQQDIKTVMDAHVGDLMAIDGVTAVAIGALEDGTPCIRVYVVQMTAALAAKIPKTLGGHPVVVEESGVIEPLSDDEG